MDPELIRRLLERQQAQTLPELDLTPQQTPAARLSEDDLATPPPQLPAPTAPPLVQGEDELQRQLRQYLQRRMAEEEQGPTGRQRASAMLLALGGQTGAAERALAPRSNIAPQVAEYLARQQAGDVAAATREQTAALNQARLAELARKPEERARAEERQAREDAYRREHDAAVLRQQAESSAATRALAAESLAQRIGNTQYERAEKAKGQTLPATVVEGIAELPVAIQQLGRLGQAFDTYDMSGAAGKLGQALTNLTGAGWTDAAKFTAEAKLGMQGIGKIMEGGKLAAGDEAKYLAMLPKAGDSAELAKNKISQAQGFLRSLVKARLQSLRASGYRIAPELDALVGGGDASPAPAPAPAPGSSAPATKAPDAKVKMIDSETGDEIEVPERIAAALEKAGKARRQ